MDIDDDLQIENVTTFNSPFPLEIIALVQMFLLPSDFAASRLVCREWADACTKDVCRKKTMPRFTNPSPILEQMLQREQVKLKRMDPNMLSDHMMVLGPAGAGKTQFVIKLVKSFNIDVEWHQMSDSKITLHPSIVRVPHNYSGSMMSYFEHRCSIPTNYKRYMIMEEFFFDQSYVETLFSKLIQARKNNLCIILVAQYLNPQFPPLVSQLFRWKLTRPNGSYPVRWILTKVGSETIYIPYFQNEDIVTQ